MMFSIPSQRRTKRGEGPKVYSAILSLRQRGFIVLRAGRHEHKIQKAGQKTRRLDDTRLVAFAGQVTA